MRFDEYLRERGGIVTNYLLLSHNDLDGYAPEVLMEKTVRQRVANDKLFAIHMSAGKSLDEFIEKCIKKKHFTTVNGAEIKIGIDRNNLKENGYTLSTNETRNGKDDQLEGFQHIDCILITDLFPQNSASIYKLRKIQSDCNVPYFIFDHHASAYQYYIENMNGDTFDEQIVLEFKDKRENAIFPGPPSGTSLLAEALLRYFEYIQDPQFHIYDFSELVRQWDTWDWKNAYPKDAPNLEPKKLNSLFNMIDHNEFVQIFVENDTSKILLWDRSKYKALLDYNEFALQKNIKDAKTNGVRYELKNGKKMLIIGDYKSSVGEIADGIFADIAFADIDVVMSIGFKAVSFRSRNNVDIPFDCSKLAMELGGGGHPNAAGAVIQSHTLSFSTGSDLPKNIKFDLK